MSEMSEVTTEIALIKALLASFGKHPLISSEERVANLSGKFSDDLLYAYVTFKTQELKDQLLKLQDKELKLLDEKNKEKDMELFLLQQAAAAQAAPVTPQDDEKTITLFREALEQHDAGKEAKSLIISTTSLTSVRHYLEHLNLIVTIAQLGADEVVDATITPFEWDDNQSEDKHMPRISTYLNETFTTCGVILGKDGYEIYDVHSDKTLLSFEDEKAGKVSGGTDIIIGPNGVAEESLAQVSCVAIEVKTAKNVRDNGLKHFSAQGTLELIAANYHSNQMTLVIVTDLATGAAGWTLKQTDKGNIGIVRYDKLTLQQMMSLIISHLKQNCVPDNEFLLKNAVDDEKFCDKESVQIQKKFKSSHVSGVSLAVEHFHELLELTPNGSRERAQVIQEFFWSQNLPKSNYLDMYI